MGIKAFENVWNSYVPFFVLLTFKYLIFIKITEDEDRARMQIG